MPSRKVARVVSGRPASDGAGVQLFRVIATPELDHVDPFLLLDEFRSDRPDEYLAGFPDHPHRGFETVTYMLAGSMEHRDHAGNHGLLGPGSIQWMTAGRGIIHSEMPRQQDGLMWGFQLWVNLPASQKMTAPRYQDIAPERVPVASVDGARVKVLAGEAQGLRGPVEGIVTEPLYLDVALEPGASFRQPLPEEHSAFAYVFEGEAQVGEPGSPIERGRLAILGPGDSVLLHAERQAARLLLLAARPLREPVARYGPFVMNTRAEIAQAFQDFQSGTFLSSRVP
jgi:redox-sensitive bicupin YhaK (pirin superfamily)